MDLTVDQVLQKGVEAHRAGKAQEADQYYTAVLKAQPKHPDANHNLGVLAVGLGKVDEALPFFKTALEVNPNIEQYWLSYINALIKLGRKADAHAALEQAKSNKAKGDSFDKVELQLKTLSVELKNQAQEDMSTPPNILDELKLDKALRLAKQKVRDGLSEEAKKIYQDIIKKFPKNKKASDGIKTLASKTSANISETEEPPSAELQGLVNLYTQGQYQETLGKGSQLLEQFPNSINLYNIIGAASKGLGKLDSAIEAYAKALSIKPDYADAYNNMGVALTEQGKLSEAVEVFRKGLFIKPDHSEAYSNMGNALKEQGELEEAIEAYTKALSVKPNFTEAHYNMGVVLKEQGKLEEAIEAYNKALSLKPDYAEVYNNLGNALRDQDKLEEAIQAYNKALSLKPDYSEVYNNIGNAFRDQGKLEEAIEAFEKSIDQLSIAKALECTYFLGNYDDFNLRLNSIAKRDPANIRVAAISAFAANQTQSEDVYPFCPNPIELIKFSHIKNHVSDFNSLITDILNEMNEKNSVWEPQNKTTKGGFQTRDQLFANSSPNMKILEDILKKELNLFRAEFNNYESVLFQKWPDEIKINAWYVRMLQNGHQDSHIHPGGWVSGVFYLKTVEAPVKHEGAIEFGLQGYKYPVIDENYPKHLYQPLNGDLVLFPSSLFHKTIPVLKDVERCVIAFDLIR